VSPVLPSPVLPRVNRLTEKVYRSVFDFELERFAVYGSKIDEFTLFDEEDPQTRSSRFIFGRSYDATRSEHVYRSEFPVGKRRNRRADFPKDTPSFLRGVGFFDCRFAYRDLRCSPTSDSSIRHSQRLQTGDTTSEIEVIDPHTIEVITHLPPPNVIAKGWKHVHSRKREQFDIANGLMINARYDFHWISLNEEIDDALFDPAHLESAEAILALLDPEKVGAKKLIGQPPRIRSGDDE